jgi:hypothetical protein
MAMNLDDRRIDHRIFHVWIIRDGVENPFENTSFHPVAVAFEYRIPIAKHRGKIAPPPAIH